MSAAEPVPVLTVSGVQKSYPSRGGSVAVLEGVDLDVAGGEVVAVAGRSGSGKTTLLMIVTGWEQPDRGSVALDGTGAGPWAWSEVAVLPQSLGLLDELTIAENIGLPRRLMPVGPGDDPEELMDRLGVAHLADRHPDEVSLGEQQRAALARAAVVRPRLLVADEPISHQNRGWAEAMMRVIGRLAAGGTACVLATHNEIAFDGADRVVDLRAGRLVARGRGDGGYVAPHG